MSSSVKSIQIEAAKPADMFAVLELIKELARYEKASNEVEMTLEMLIEDGFGENKCFDCIVAKDLNQSVVGFALFYMSYSTWKGKCLYLEDLLVSENYRNKGVGSLLFHELIRLAKVRRVKRFQWQVLDWNEPAINFYKKYNAILEEEWINCKLVFPIQ
jgi:GNAT superfamily N-acetyltransferase